MVRSKYIVRWPILKPVTSHRALRPLAEWLVYQFSHLHTIGNNRIYLIALS